MLCTGTVLHAAPATADESNGWTLPQLTVTNGTLTDVTGRTVLLRGMNVNQLNDYARNDPNLPTVAPLDDTDFAQMAALGVDVVRLNIAWSALEPTPGAFDEGYVARIRSAVNQAKAHGIYTVLDMHQDAWGKTVGTPAGATCPSFMSRGYGWDGAPGWATITDGNTTCNIGHLREASPAVADAFQHFYDNTDGIQDHLVATWARLAAEFKDEPAVAGYDLMNEPNPGLRDPFTAAAQLGRYYQRAIAAIRQGERGGMAHLAMFEPSAIWSALGLDATPPTQDITDPLAVFAPHLYSESINVDNSFPTIEQGFDLAEAAAARYRVPLWTGEWGWFGDPAADESKVNRFVDQENAHRMGGAWWSWKQTCGDPHVVAGGNTDKPTGNINPVSCPSGTPLGQPAAYAAPLARAYPRAAPGTLTSLAADGFAGEGRGRLEAWYPGGQRPDPQATGVTGLVVTQVAGGWQVTGTTNGRYSLGKPGTAGGTGSASSGSAGSATGSAGSSESAGSGTGSSGS
ncbi:glycosidase [Nocardia stercoris]|uniref:Glycosidase n=2 Tax=Nocardia stercoris TaxID=2483361 RepID=A0A3M2KYY0_9NOCA|nr:cellulase family glycosylhydrolase [Nocardia stercoris]RMI30491.1 glycosidase [Nocardia stercoris]